MKVCRLSLLPLLLFLAVGVALPPSASGAGTVENTLLSQEKAKCKKVAKKKKKACLKKAVARAKNKLKKLQSGEGGLYGFNLPDKLIPRQAGKLIWSKPLAKTPGAGQTHFILYSSLAYPGGKPSVVSGVLSLPSGKAPRGGWPLVSWAHGTTGLADSCAPSKGIDGSYGEAGPFVSRWLEKGYAVVGSDYQGLGTPGPHPYLVGPSEGRSVLDAALASKTFTNIKRTTLVGHSQGGHATLWAASLLPSYKEIRADRSISYAPPSLLNAQADLISTQPDDAYGISALAISILRGATIAEPEIDPREILSEEALNLYPRVEAVCLDQLGTEAESAELSPDKLLRPDWKSTPSGQKFYSELEDTNPSLPLSGKALLVQGMEDTTVLPLFTNVLAGDLNSLNPERITYMRFSNRAFSPGGFAENYSTETPSTHSSILGDSWSQVSSWMGN